MRGHGVTLRVYAEKQPVYVDPAEVSSGESLGRGVWEGGIARSSVAGPALCYRSTSARVPYGLRFMKDAQSGRRTGAVVVTDKGSDIVNAMARFIHVSRVAVALYPPYPPVSASFSVVALRPYIITVENVLILLYTAHVIACLTSSLHTCTSTRARPAARARRGR